MAAEVEIAVEGEVERVTYENRETGFRVVKVAVDGKKQRLAIVGVFPSVAVGARVRARGKIELDRQHGEQLRATNVTELAPTTLAGLERYLGSGSIKGIGLVTAQRIVARFGLETLKVLDEKPDRLREVPGLGPARADALAAAWQENRALRDVMVFLQAHGASPHLASRVFKRYGPKAVAIVSDDPYRLAVDVWGIGFRTADRIAASLGVARDSITRMQAALVQALRDAMDQGHCYVVGEELVGRGVRLLADSPEEAADPSPEMRVNLERALIGIVRAQYVVAERAGTIERIDANLLAGTLGLEELARLLLRAAIFEAKMHETESRLGARLGLFAQRSADAQAASGAAKNKSALRGIDDAIAKFQEESGTVLAEEQRLAVARAASCPLLIVTGGPGVGKTTIVKAILSVFDRAGVITRLAAPTGRAAKRMSEATGRDAMTLHRLLEFDPKTATFKRDAKRPVDAGALVVDESSMVDVWLADALTQAVADGARLVLVGDVDQLPSVGPGSVLRDAIASGVVPCVRLVKIFRQAEQSLIVQNAHRINGGEEPYVPEKGDTSADFFIVEKRDPDEARRVILDLVTKHIPRRFLLDPVRDVQVLTPMNRGPAGTAALNEALQAALNPSGAALVRGKTTFRVGDKVMQLRNDYDRNVWNGDVGVVAAIDTEESSLVVRYDEGAEGQRDVPYDGGSLDELALAYACTIHKSQGSEYPAVVIPFLTSHFVMLSKNLLYTAVTRGKRLVVLVADPRAVRMSLAPRDQDPSGGDEGNAAERGERGRHTKLAARIQASGEACGDRVGG